MSQKWKEFWLGLGALSVPLVVLLPYEAQIVLGLTALIGGLLYMFFHRSENPHN